MALTVPACCVLLEPKKSSGLELGVIFHPRPLTLCLLLMELRLVVAINNARLKHTEQSHYNAWLQIAWNWLESNCATREKNKHYSKWDIRIPLPFTGSLRTCVPQLKTFDLCSITNYDRPQGIQWDPIHTLVIDKKKKVFFKQNNALFFSILQSPVNCFSCTNYHRSWALWQPKETEFANFCGYILQ